MTTDAQMLSLEDERQVIAVLIRYATGIDTRNWKLFRTCFTDDFKGEYGNFGSWKSNDEITKDMDKMHADLGPTQHRMTNFAVTAAGSGASVRSYVDVILNHGEVGGPFHHAAGYYDDEFVKTGEGWKIKRRTFTITKLP